MDSSKSIGGVPETIKSREGEADVLFVCKWYSYVFTSLYVQCHYIKNQFAWLPQVRYLHFVLRGLLLSETLSKINLNRRFEYVQSISIA